MGSTINPRARGGASLSGELRASRDDRQQIRRLFSAPAKPKVTAAAGTGTWAVAYSETVGANLAGYPSFTDWQFSDDGIGLSQNASDSTIFGVPPGLYMAKLYLQIGVSPVRADFWVSANSAASSSYVVHEFPLHIDTTGDHAGSHTIGPLPVTEAGSQGYLSASFFFPVSAGVPTVDGSCRYILAKIG